MADIKTLVENFGKFETDMKATLDKQQAEIKAHGETSAETAKEIANLGEKLREVGQELKAAQETLAEVQARANRPGAGAEARKSVGARFVESDEYKAMAGTNVARTDAVEMGSFFAPRMATLTSASESGGANVEPQRFGQIIADPERAMRLRDIMDVQPTGSNAIEYVRETGFTNAAASRAEGGAAQESTITFALESVSVRSIAHFLPATREILNDAAQLRAYIDGRLLYGLKVKEEQQILYGTGTSPQLTGITTDPDVQTYAWSDGAVGDTKVDAIRRAMTKARVAEYPVNGIVLHPTDWEEIELLKGSDEKYIWVQVPDGGVMRLWRVPVIETTAVTAGSSVLGAFGMAATLWDREQGTVRASDSHADFFTSGKIALVAEERVALTVFRPEGFVSVDFDAAPVAGSS